LSQQTVNGFNGQTQNVSVWKRLRHVFGDSLPPANDNAPPKVGYEPQDVDRVLLGPQLPHDPRVDTAIRQRSWKDEVIYMAMTDRFHRGEPVKTTAVDPKDPERFHGGDWQGIIDKLDYIKGLGASTVWISPVQMQTRDFFGKDGYHGYWASDFYKPEPSFGNMEKLQELVQKAHEKGLKVMVDLVLNHTGYGSPMSLDPKYNDWFHHYGAPKLPTQWWFENGTFCGLPDFAQEKPEVARWLIDMTKYWIDQTGIDGLRLDAVRHVPQQFWRQFSDEIHQHAGDNFMLLGEIYHYDTKWTTTYQNDAKLDSVFDFPFNFALRDTVGSNKEGLWNNLKFFATHVWSHPGESFRKAMNNDDGDMRRVARVLRKDNEYVRPDFLVTMLDNHDMPRFITAAGEHGLEKTKLALALMFGMRGIPSLYYGTEAAMKGGFEGGVNENRQDMQFGANPQMQEYVTKLAHLRHDSVALRRGGYKELMATESIYAFARPHPQQTAVIAVNNGALDAPTRVPVKGTVGDGTLMQDMLSGRQWPVRKGAVEVNLEARQAVILLPVEGAPRSFIGTP
jgi:alpha-amylase